MTAANKRCPRIINLTNYSLRWAKPRSKRFCDKNVCRLPKIGIGKYFLSLRGFFICEVIRQPFPAARSTEYSLNIEFGRQAGEHGVVDQCQHFGGLGAGGVACRLEASVCIAVDDVRALH